jgi:Leucine-rich repeat (LRR) protein
MALRHHEPTTIPQSQYVCDHAALCDRISDASVLSISKNLHALRTLYLCDLEHLTDASVSALAGLPNLEELHLSGCVQISSSSLIALLHNLEKLQCLNIGKRVTTQLNAPTSSRTVCYF